MWIQIWIKTMDNLYIFAFQALKYIKQLWFESSLTLLLPFYSEVSNLTLACYFPQDLGKV